jgi:sortase A
VATRTATPAPATSRGSRRWRIVRRSSNALIGLGVAILLYAGVIFAWGDPVTWVWAHWEQHQMTGALHKLERQYGGRAAPAGDQDALAFLRTQAQELRRAQSSEGDPLGRIVIGRIGLNVIFVQGTSRFGALDKGPGHYEETPLPGMPGTVGIAAHRTTFGAWFRHIDSIRDGDFIELRMPYGTYKYQVQYHRIVDWEGTRASITRDAGYERLILSACHPLYSADKRWIVFAKAVSVTLPGGRTISMG